MSEPVTTVAAAPPTGDAVPAAPPKPRPTFPCLEGLRGIGAAMVCWSHTTHVAGSAAPEWMVRAITMMEFALPMFFGISGFLIYMPFARAHLEGSRGPRLGGYLWRRVLRIFPAYWVALSVLWATGMVHLGSDWWKFYLLLQVFDAYAFLRGIVQAWSLSTEMCFYLLVPIWFFVWGRLVVRNSRSVRRELAGIGVLFAMGYLSRALFSWTNHLWAPPHGQDVAGVTMRQVAFSWLPNQLDFFALGMGLAVVHAWAVREGRLEEIGRKVGRWPTAFCAVCFALFLYATYVMGPVDFHIGFKGYYWQKRTFVFTVMGIILLTPMVFGDQDEGVVRRVLRWRPLSWFGMVTYAFYIWHLDLLQRAVTTYKPNGQVRWTGWLNQINQRVHIPGLGTGPHAASFGNTNVWVLGVTVWILGLSAAALSWYLVEKPLQRLKRLF